MSETAAPTAVTVTQRAARRIREIVAGEPDNTMLRISVEGGGCSGFRTSSTWSATERR